MNQLEVIFIITGSLIIGAILGYYARQSIAQKQVGTIEAKLQKKILKAREVSEEILSTAKEKAREISQTLKKEEDERRSETLRLEKILFKRENILDKRISDLELEQKNFQEKVARLKEIKESLEGLKQECLNNLERIAELSKEEAKKELFENLEKEYRSEILEKIKKIEKEDLEKFERKAKEILTTAIQKCTISQTQEITTTSLPLPSEDIKGKIIGKEGRNIRTLEKLTGVEVIIDETPQTLIISGFDPIRRQIAKISLEKLIRDGRIQPARIEEKVEEAKKEITSQIKEAGETVVYELGLIGFDLKLIQLLGRLKFRTSYGQSVLLHSLEVAYLASALASEIGANSLICKKAGLLHDIGKALDHQIEGSHTEIGIKVLEKFGVEKEVIWAMKSHHEEHPYENLEAVLVQVADQISGARPGARRDNFENYLKRLTDLENIATSFNGVEKAWALQAGREIRVFVKPEEIDDLTAKKLAREIAGRIQEELKYPGEIKVNVIREMRVIEYAK
ncbi:MAG: ribonuclease Y [Candidatus Nealsonbacteria bacterium]|nr:ribonuclease Y [Candidatus Nealsonbacteria bacterium]